MLSEIVLTLTFSGQLVHNLSGHVLPVSAVSVVAGGSRVVSASLDGIIYIWGLEDGECRGSQ